MVLEDSAPMIPVAMAADNVWKLAQLRQVLARAELAGVPVLVLKGAALLDWLYELNERPMVDVDLLIRPEHAERFARTFGGIGAIVQWALPDEPSSEFGCEIGGVSLDVHVALLNAGWLGTGTTDDNTGLWARAETFSVLGQPALRLGPDDQLLHLAAHTVLHHLDWSEVGVEDIRRLLLRAILDWPLVVQLARQRRVCTALWLVLSSPTTRGLAPDWVLNELRPGFLKLWLAGVARKLSARGETMLAPMLLLDDPSDMLRATVQRALPPDTWLQVRYPSIRSTFRRRMWHAIRIGSRVGRRLPQRAGHVLGALRVQR
jgi:hypothetical protein